jgi:hypothetical protein
VFKRRQSISKVKYRTDFILQIFIARYPLSSVILDTNGTTASIRAEFTSIPRKNTTSSSLLREFRVVLCLSQSPIQQVSGAVSSGDKVAKIEAGNSHLSSAKDSNH